MKVLLCCVCSHFAAHNFYANHLAPLLFVVPSCSSPKTDTSFTVSPTYEPFISLNTLAPLSVRLSCAAKTNTNASLESPYTPKNCISIDIVRVYTLANWYFSNKVTAQDIPPPPPLFTKTQHTRTQRNAQTNECKHCVA